MSLSFYTFGIVIAKACALKGLVKGKVPGEQNHYYKLSGIILIVASVLYVVYSTRLLWHPMVSHYDKYIGLGIATFAFTELGLNIRGVIVERHNHTLLFHAIRMINLAATLIGCVMLWCVRKIKRKQEMEEDK